VAVSTVAKIERGQSQSRALSGARREFQTSDHRPLVITIAAQLSVPVSMPLFNLQISVLSVISSIVCYPKIVATLSTGEKAMGNRIIPSSNERELNYPRNCHENPCT